VSTAIYVHEYPSLYLIYNNKFHHFPVSTSRSRSPPKSNQPVASHKCRPSRKMSSKLVDIYFSYNVHSSRQTDGQTGRQTPTRIAT